MKRIFSVFFLVSFVTGCGGVQTLLGPGKNKDDNENVTENISIDDSEESKPAGDDSETKTEDVEKPLSWPPQSSSFLYPSPEQRETNWNPETRDAKWFLDWEAYGLPAMKSQPYHLWFQNPHDDDLHTLGPRGACKYRPDDPSPGLLTVNRINDANGRACGVDDNGIGGRNFTGNIGKRLELFEPAMGATFEYEVQIPDLSTKVQSDALTVSYVWSGGSFAVYHSPGCIKIGKIFRPEPSDGHYTCSSISGKYSGRAYDSRDEFHKYRIVLQPSSLEVELYIDDNPVPFLSGQGSAAPFTRLYDPGEPITAGDTEYEHPYLLIGDNTTNSVTEVANNDDVSAAYTLRRVRARPGVFVPGDPLTDLAPLVPPWLPANAAVIQTAGQGLEFDALPSVNTEVVLTKRYFAGDAGTTFKIGVLSGEGVFAERAEPLAGSGLLHIDNSTNGSYLMRGPEGLIGNAAWTFEIRLKMGEQSSERGFAFNVWDRIGMSTVLFSPQKIELALGGKQVGISAAVPLDLTKEFVTVRLMRKKNDPYVYLFVNDLPRPVVADFVMSAQQMNGSNAAYETRIWFGAIGHGFTKDYISVANYAEYIIVNEIKMDVVIDYIRWDDQVTKGAPL